MFKKWSVVCVSIFALLVGGAHAADDFPSRPITLVVPFPAGGGNDALARAVAEKMGPSLGKPVVVENRVGGAGTVGTRGVAKSPPDGYTVLLGFTGSLAINPTLIPSAGIDPVKDFEPVGRISALPIVLVVRTSSPFKSLADLVAYAKANPGKINYASSGTGTTVHLATEMLAKAAGVKLTHVPYRGTGPAMTDLLGGHVDTFMSTIALATENIKGGNLRGLAVASPARLAALPDIPTIAESGYPTVDGMSLYGLLAPAGTPRPIVARLNQAMNDALALDDVKAKLAMDAGLPMPSTPEEYGNQVKKDAQVWGSLVKELGLKAE